MSKYFKDFDELKRILKNLDYNLSDDKLETIGIMLRNNINIYDTTKGYYMENSIELLFNIILDLYGADFIRKNILKCSQTSYYNLHNYLIHSEGNKPTHVYKQLELFYNIITSYFIGNNDE